VVSHARHPLRDAAGNIVLWYLLESDVDDRKRAEVLLAGEKRLLELVASSSSQQIVLDAFCRFVEDAVSGCRCGIVLFDANGTRVEYAAGPSAPKREDDAADVITRLRALFTKTTAISEAVDLNEATREVIALSSSELQRNGIVLRVELAGNLPAVTGDRVQLQQVILNLLLNAADAMAGIGERPKLLPIRTERDGDGERVRLIVRDSGVGFDSQNAEKLFESFFTTKSSGMGIGLSVSRTIIESHQGRLWAEANDEHGTTFTFSIPCGVADR
jgi:signal transduction histidine kinase